MPGYEPPYSGLVGCLSWTVQNEGMRGLYRGIVPGSLSVFQRNGAAMIVMQRANAAITRLGLRDA